jgi:toxin FitB
MFTTCITQAEMLVGMEIMPAGRKRMALADHLFRIFETDFAGRVLPFDGRAARALSAMPLQRDRNGKPVMDSDALIAAIALANGAALATRNTKHFARFGVELINPWRTGEGA